MAGLKLKIEGFYCGADISFEDSAIQGSQDANSFMEMLEVLDEGMEAHCHKVFEALQAVDISYGFRNISAMDGTAVVEMFDRERSIAVGTITWFDDKGE